MKQLFFLLAICHLQVQAQDSTKPARIVPFNAKVSLMDGQTASGWLYTADDDEIKLLLATNKELKRLGDSSFSPQSRLQAVAAENINTIKLRRQHSTRRGMLIGMTAGIVTGVIIGFASGDDELLEAPPPGQDFLGLGTLAVGLYNSFAMTAGEKAAVGAAAGAVFGALTGALVGALVKKKFTIGGKKQKYRDLQGELMQRLIVKP